MSREIERKFLLDELPSGLESRDWVEIEQGYLAVAEGAEVRVRRAGEECTLTVKLGSGEARDEHETELTASQFEVLWPAGADARLRKRRYLVPLQDGLKGEVDVYSAPLAGLRVAEVEFASEPEARAFRPPSWFGREVTGDRRFANQSLAIGGMPDGVHSEHRSRAYLLKRKEGVGDGMRRIATGRAEKALERLRGASAEDGEFADAVHGARKDLKKLRAVVRLLRHQLGEKVYEEENGRYRDAARALSESRDAKVKLETLETLGKRFPDLPAGPLEIWRRGLERDCRRALEGTEEIPVSEAIALIEAGGDRIERWQLDAGSWKLIDRGVLRAYGRGRTAMGDAEAEPSEESFHQWRKRVKDLWYTLRLLRRAWPGVLGATAEEAHALADLLGDHHDLAVLREDLGDRSLPAEGSAALAAAIGAREEELAGAAFELGRRLYAERPKAFRRRIHGYWRAWRAG